jgi:hypothetical protein
MLSFFLNFIKGLFNAFDENRDNHIDFKEISCGLSACCRGPLAERQKCKWDKQCPKITNYVQKTISCIHVRSFVISVNLMLVFY